MCAALCACKTVEGGPDRLYSVQYERAQAQALLDGVEGLVARYYAVDIKNPAGETERKYYRNEIIARRMYIIDVEYSEYEASLTAERQKFGFATTAAATGLGIASTLTTPVRSAQILSGVGAAILSSRGAVDSEIAFSKSLQIIQGYMRAARDLVASRQILSRLEESTLTFSLSAALHSLEDYYRAGTFTAGLLPALEEAGAAAKVAADEKAVTISYASTDTTKALSACLSRGKGQAQKLAALVTPSTPFALAQIRFGRSIKAEADRSLLLVRARVAGICL